MWDGQVEPMIARGRRVVRYDFAGHGDSDAPRGPVSIATFGEYLVGLLRRLDIARAYVCGCSLGGMIAQSVAASHPDLVAGIVLANTGAQIGTMDSWNARIAAVRQGGMTSIRDSVLSRFFSRSFRDRAPTTVAQIGAMIDATDPHGYIAACTAIRDADLRDSSRTISAPTLIVAGALDVSTPPARSEELRDIIPGSTLIVVPDAAHLTNVERPSAFNGALMDFIDRCV
jgi:3-oxoadipate enol-lactonase